MDDRPLALSFASLDARIEAMPDGPASILKTPRILYWLNILGSIAIVFGLRRNGVRFTYRDSSGP